MTDTIYTPFSNRTPECTLNQRVREAAQVVAAWDVVHRPTAKSAFVERIRIARTNLFRLEKSLARLPDLHAMGAREGSREQEVLFELRSHRRLLRSSLLAVAENPSFIAILPRVLHADRKDDPRILAAAHIYLHAVQGEFAPDSFRLFIAELQARDPLQLDELWNSFALLRFSLLESLLDGAFSLIHTSLSPAEELLHSHLTSLRFLSTFNPVSLIESLILFDAILAKDPAAAYSSMDFESRQRYRARVAFLARHSDCTETDVARIALRLAQASAGNCQKGSRKHIRQTHIGYYLIDKGSAQLESQIGFHGPLSHRALTLVRSNAEDFYLPGVHVITVLVISAVLFPLLPHSSSLLRLAIAFLLLWIPAMQVGVELANYVASTLFQPMPLPKLDFSKGIPTACATLVAVPSLLLNEKQVRDLMSELEVRYLANPDPNLHFALLSDLPDSISKPHDLESHPLLDLAIELVSQLNAKYGTTAGGAFMLLHRRRVFNTRQGVWMGWERKRGKLLDLNKLLTAKYDAFPIKAGNLAPLQTTRYVLTLDSDTQLPRGVAARLVGAIAHPLNQAVIDPKSRIVTEGYGILQPRIGITVRSTSRSRLAAIFSGRNGFDIYSRAISDPYQDLFGEGIFTGKGIYEVASFHEVLDRRFPRNALLSHDLIEGAYARAGLVQDVELIDDYPSHYSAYSRRKHRWVRGDWQIAQWMFSRVPDEAGHGVPNPISTISRWKIFDNLRRSLVDPSLLLLLLAGWIFLPGGPGYWTIVPLVLLVVPSAVQFSVGLVRACGDWRNSSVIDLLSGFSSSLFLVLLNLVFLLHQAFLALDAIIRSIFRGFITGERLLEWETAEQAEDSIDNKTPVDRYLAFMPFATATLAGLIWLSSQQSSAILIAAPLLLLWSLAPVVTLWINRPRTDLRPVAPADENRLLEYAFRIWRYFSQYGGASHNYLIPDNVEEEGFYEAARTSPTNIGLLLNARLAAVKLGFLTTPEFALSTSRSLSTITRLTKFRGHLFNWYDTNSLETLGDSPQVSSVDSGNFVASLLTLQAGARDLLRQPLVAPQLFQGIRICSRCSNEGENDEGKQLASTIPEQSSVFPESFEWLQQTLSAFSVPAPSPLLAMDYRHTTEVQDRINATLSLATNYCPWLLPEYARLGTLLGRELVQDIPALNISESLYFACSLQRETERAITTLTVDPALRALAARFLTSITSALNNLRALETSLLGIATQADTLANETDFSFLANHDRLALSIGYDLQTSTLDASCYDMVASEARVATFLAIARGDLPLQAWSALSREHIRTQGTFLLLSWSGTMFEYLMPTIWMQSYPGTLVMRTQVACVKAQRTFARALNIPWGISESGFAEKDDTGHYQYMAFGVPSLALSPEAKAGPVISPYSTFLALSVDSKEALGNLVRMESAGSVGRYGFYEALDYSASRTHPIVVREWMAHHQGMSLLAVTNVLHSNIVQRWFHSNPIVRSAELLLHEIPMSNGALKARMKDFA